MVLRIRTLHAMAAWGKQFVHGYVYLEVHPLPAIPFGLTEAPG